MPDAAMVVSPAEMARLVDELNDTAQRLADADALDRVDTATIQQLLALAISLYVARRQAGSDFAPVAEDAIEATEAVITVTELLKAVNVNLFELTLWNGLGRTS